MASSTRRIPITKSASWTTTTKTRWLIRERTAVPRTNPTATGGIITPSTGTDTEHYEFEFTTSSNSFAAAGSTVNMNFNVWYDLPNLKREALVTLALVMADNDGRTFSKTVDVQVAP